MSEKQVKGNMDAIKFKEKKKTSRAIEWVFLRFHS